MVTLEGKTDKGASAKVIIADTPLKWCSVRFSEMLAADRLDADSFHIEARQARAEVIHNKYLFVPLMGKNGLVEQAYYPPRFKRIYLEEDNDNGVPFFLPSQIVELYPKAEKFISKITRCNIEDLCLKDNTLLLTRSGTIGTVARASKATVGKAFSDDVIRVTFSSLQDLGYVYAFFKTKYGNLVLQNNGYGAVITHIEPEDLENIPIPNAPAELREKINGLIVRSYDLRDESNALIDEATRLLIKELKLPPLRKFFDKDAPTRAWSAKLSNLNDRLDAGYHAPLADAVEEHLKKHAGELATVGDSRVSEKVILPGRFKRVYVGEGQGRTFIGSKQIGELDPSNKKYLSYAYHRKQIKALELRENMTLITCSGTIGRAAFVCRHWEKWTASQHVIRIVPASGDIAGYLYIFLASDYGHQLIARCSYGAVVQEIDDSHVREIPFPLLKNREAQAKINALALEANEKRYEAYCLEQEALEVMDREVIHAK